MLTYGTWASQLCPSSVIDSPVTHAVHVVRVDIRDARGVLDRSPSDLNIPKRRCTQSESNLDDIEWIAKNRFQDSKVTLKFSSRYSPPRQARLTAVTCGWRRRFCNEAYEELLPVAPHQAESI